MGADFTDLALSARFLHVITVIAGLAGSEGVVFVALPTRRHDHWNVHILERKVAVTHFKFRI